MSKVRDIMFTGASAFVAGLLYEQGRKAGSGIDVTKLSPAHIASGLGNAAVTRRLNDMVKQAAKAQQN